MNIQNTVRIEVFEILNDILKENNTIDIEKLKKQFNLIKRMTMNILIFSVYKLKNGNRCSRRRKFNIYCAQHSKKHQYGN